MVTPILLFWLQMPSLIIPLFVFLNLICIGGGGAPPPPKGLQLQNGWRKIAETLWLLLLAYYTSFGILFGHQGPKLLPW